MMPPALPVLLTGASGTIGRMLARRLPALGWRLRLTDIASFPDPVPAGATFTRTDLAEAAAVAPLARGCGLVLHFGGVSTEQPLEATLGPNIQGLFNIYEAARREKVRVVFASSNHVFGLYTRDERLDQAALPRPDGFYGLSKAYGEMLARLYWDKHAVESVLVRIGSMLPEVPDARILSTWISPDDFVRLMVCCATAGPVGCTVVWGASANSRSFWGDDGRAVIGWEPQDSSDGAAAAVRNRVTGDPIAERYQGGRFASIDWSRDGPAPAAMFEETERGRS